MPAPRVVPLHLADVRPTVGGRAVVPIVAHVITHRDGVFLFDTGIGTGNAEIDAAFSPTRYPLEVELAAYGIELPDVTALANCHLHFDHSGHNGLFPGRPIFAQAREWALVHEPDYTVPSWIDRPELRYELLDGETEVAPGIRLLPTPGHTPGHQSLVVATDEGTVVVAGQAVWTRAEWEGATGGDASGEPTADDREAYASSVEAIRRLEPIRVHFAHDREVWNEPVARA